MNEVEEMEAAWEVLARLRACSQCGGAEAPKLGPEQAAVELGEVRRLAEDFAREVAALESQVGVSDAKAKARLMRDSTLRAVVMRFVRVQKGMCRK